MTIITFGTFIVIVVICSQKVIFSVINILLSFTNATSLNIQKMKFVIFNRNFKFIYVNLGVLLSEELTFCEIPFIKANSVF